MREGRSSVGWVGTMSVVAAATLGALVIIMVLVSSAAAYTVLGAYFYPDHGVAGARIVVDGLPLKSDCPTVAVWLVPGQASSPSIASAADHRLIRLPGITSHPPVGAGGVGDTRPGTTFTSRVPAIAPGKYSTYSRCTGSLAFGFGGGATTFTVDTRAPDTDTMTPGAFLGEAPFSGSPPIVTSLLAGLVGSVLFLRRVSAVRRPPTMPGRRDP